MSTWMVTGGTGFLGRFAIERLETARAAGDRVVALGRKRPPDWPPDWFVEADLDDPNAIRRAVSLLRPDVVIHLAGATPPADAERLFRVNTGGTARLLAALRESRRPARVIVVGSAAELGPVPAERLPIDESTPCRPADAYGLSKWFATSLALRRGGPLEIVVARVFNPIGPGMPETQAFGRFAAILARRSPEASTLSVGPLETKRDFIDVRDVASALVALAEAGRPGLVYHVGSGVSRSIGEGLEHLIARRGRPVEVVSHPPPRPGPSDSRADIERIQRHTGWLPRIDWTRSLDDLWESARARHASRHVA